MTETITLSGCEILALVYLFISIGILVLYFSLLRRHRQSMERSRYLINQGLDLSSNVLELNQELIETIEELKDESKRTDG